MRMRNFSPPILTNTNKHRYAMIICGITVLFFVGLAAEPARAEENININLRIEAPSQTILNQQISVPFSCEVTDSAGVTSTYEGYKAICALQSVQEQALLTYNANNFGWGLFIEKINNIGNDANMFWALYQNNSASMVGATDLDLSTDNQIVLSYVDWNYNNEILQVALASSTVYSNSSTTLQAQIWNNTEFINFNSPVVFFINGTAYDAASGALEYTPDTNGQKEIYVEAVGKTRSEKQIINVIPAPIQEPTQTTVNLNLRYQNNLIFSDQVILPTSTTILDNSGIEHFTTSTNVLTALLAADATSTDFFVSDLQYYDAYKSFYVNCVETTATTTPLCANWNYAVNNIYPSVGMNQYALTGNENIYVYFDNPWKITASTSTFPLGTTTTLQTWRYNYDNLENEWTADANNLIDISITNPNPTGWWDNTITIAATTTNNTGAVDYLFSTTGTFYAKITSPDWTKWSNPITLTVFDLQSTSTPTAPPTDNGSGGGGNYTPTYSNIDTEKAIQYLTAKQQNGDFASALYTDWAAMAFGAYDRSNATSVAIKNYLLTDPSPTAGFNAVSDYARRAMALMALEINPYQTKTNYIKKITDTFNGTELVDKPENQGLFNDDIFALITLHKAGYSEQDEIIKQIIAFILSKQVNNNWGSVDLTAAAIQALKPFSSNSPVSKAITDATLYLKNEQQADGGFANNSFSTSWTIQAGDAIGENNLDWIKKSKNYLSKKQQTDGSIDNDLWATAQAIPPALDKSWNDILVSFSKATVETPQSTSGSSQETNNTTQTSTSTASTLTIPTSTIELVIETPTSTVATTTLSITQTTTTDDKIQDSDNTTTNITQNAVNKTQTIENKKINAAVSTTSNIQNDSQQFDNQTTEQLKNNEIAGTPQESTQNISAMAENTLPINKTAKGVFAGATSLAGALGLYLAWRFIQTIV